MVVGGGMILTFLFLGLKMKNHQQYQILYVNNNFLRFLNKILGPSYIYTVLFNAQNLPYDIRALTNLPFFSIKSRRLFTVRSPTCNPGKLYVAKSIMALELRKRLLLKRNVDTVIR